MEREGIGTTTIVIIAVLVVVAVAGGYMLLSGGSMGEEVIDTEDVSSLRFNFGQISEENIEPSGTMKIMDLNDRQKLKIRYSFSLEDKESEMPIMTEFILNKELETGWIYFEEVPSGENYEPGWYLFPDVEYADFENDIVEMCNDLLESIPENWAGEDFTLEGEETRIYNIDVNPSLDDELFSVENYKEAPEL